MSIIIKIDEDDALEMLMDRVHYWTDNPEVLELYSQMYWEMIDNGLFDGGSSFDPKSIVDNDYVNWCRTIEKSDENFDAILELYKNGEREVGGKGFGFERIEAVSDDETLILMRR